MKTKTKKKPTSHISHASHAIVVRESQLTDHQKSVINVRTPEEFIRSKPGRGSKTVRYVEGGYVIAKLNQAFGPLSWDFEVVEQGTTERKNEKNAEGEVWVKGKLTIVDHKQGFRVSKTQYGQHNIHTSVPIGDAFKAAGTDALKKCASMLGVALDVYWGQMDEEKAPTAPIAPTQKTSHTVSAKDLFEQAKTRVASITDVSELIALDERVQANPDLPKTFKESVHALINTRVDSLQG